MPRFSGIALVICVGIGVGCASEKSLLVERTLNRPPVERLAVAQELVNNHDWDLAGTLLESVLVDATSPQNAIDAAALTRLTVLAGQRRWESLEMAGDLYRTQLHAGPDFSRVLLTRLSDARSVRCQDYADGAEHLRAAECYLAVAYSDGGGRHIRLAARQFDRAGEEERATRTRLELIAKYPGIDGQDFDRLRVAQGLEALRRPQDARQFYESLISDFPHSPYAAEAARRLDVLDAYP